MSVTSCPTWGLKVICNEDCKNCNVPKMMEAAKKELVK
jgi:hypothetical protein